MTRQASIKAAVQAQAEGYKGGNLTDAQAVSMAWADYFEQVQIRREMRNGWGAAEVRIDCYCQDCKEGGQFVPDTTRAFLQLHAGHRTRTFRIK